MYFIKSADTILSISFSCSLSSELKCLEVVHNTKLNILLVDLCIFYNKIFQDRKINETECFCAYSIIKYFKTGMINEIFELITTNIHTILQISISKISL